jgi:hypothetical protein
MFDEVVSVILPHRANVLSRDGFVRSLRFEDLPKLSVWCCHDTIMLVFLLAATDNVNLAPWSLVWVYTVEAL